MGGPKVIDIPIPALGCDELPVRLGAWLFEPGDRVVAGDRLAELIAPGVVCDLTAPESGTLLDIEFAPGASVSEGTIVCRIELSESQENNLDES